MMRKLFYAMECLLGILFLISIYYDTGLLCSFLSFIFIFIFFTFINKGWIKLREYGFATLLMVIVLILLYLFQNYVLQDDHLYTTTRMITLLLIQAFCIYSSLYIRNHVKAEPKSQ